MVSWTDVPLRTVALREEVATGAQVPGRIVALDAYRRDGVVEGFEFGARVDAIDWRGLEEALAWLDGLDVVVRMRAEA